MSDVGSNTSDWERARKPEQIEARRESILTAARHLLDQGGVEEAGLSAIARTANLSKANIYRYFESREVVLMEILMSEMGEWARELAQALREITDKGNVSVVAQAMADTLESRKRYCCLLASFASVLERNLPPVSIKRYRADLRDCFIGLIDPLMTALPQLSKSQANEFLVMQAMFQIGIWAHANPSDSAAEVLNENEFSDLKMDFIERVRWHALILLLGLESVDQPRLRPLQ